VSPARFAEQMAFLADNGLPVSLDEVLADLRCRTMPDESRVLVTFDDAALDTRALACPILKHHDIPATLFVPTGLVGRQGFWWNQVHLLAAAAAGRGIDLAAWLEQAGVCIPQEDRWTEGLWRPLRFLDEHRREELLEAAAQWLAVDLRFSGPGAMTWEELAALDRDGLFTFGAHSARHPVLAGLRPDCLTAEVEGSRDALAGFRSFRPVFAYPYGDEADVDPAAVEAVRAAGFEAAFTTGEGTLTGSDDPLALARVCIDEMPLDEFRGVLDHFLAP
jgi:peptidoglycan/xylan/chitin deacetylase (PgdA/CDA1 family)